MSADTITEYTIAVHHEDDGTYWAQVRELPGCFATGDDLDELRDGLQEAISIYLADDPSHGELSSFKPMEVGEMTVLVGA